MKKRMKYIVIISILSVLLAGCAQNDSDKKLVQKKSFSMDFSNASIDNW